MLFRDYAFGDQAQLRFRGSSHVASADIPQYVRHDGTLTYFFRTEEIQSLFEAAGFKCLSSEYIEKNVKNKKQGMQMARRFCQAKFAYCP
eukprot:SAG22_NODE_5441_length_1013_cov_1.566740_2_plen_90_part_00